MMETCLKKVIAALTVAVLCLGSVSLSGCFGEFALTGKIHQWNDTLGNKWVNTLVFWALVIVPVYQVALLGDAVIFNVIEFWGGRNPIGGVSAGPAPEQLADGSVQLRRGDQVYRLVPDGANRFTLRKGAKVVAYVHGNATDGLTIVDAESPRLRRIDSATLAALRSQMAPQL